MELPFTVVRLSMRLPYSPLPSCTIAGASHVTYVTPCYRRVARYIRYTMLQARRTRPSLLVKFVACADGRKNALLMPEILKSYNFRHQV